MYVHFPSLLFLWKNTKFEKMWIRKDRILKLSFCFLFISWWKDNYFSRSFLCLTFSLSCGGGYYRCIVVGKKTKKNNGHYECMWVQYTESFIVLCICSCNTYFVRGPLWKMHTSDFSKHMNFEFGYIYIISMYTNTCIDAYMYVLYCIVKTKTVKWRKQLRVIFGYGGLLCG